MTRVWIAHATTEFGDHYFYAFKAEPTYETVYRKVWEGEGKPESLRWYRHTTSVQITEAEVL